MDGRPMNMECHRTAYKGIARMVGSETLAAWRAYQAFRDERFAFYDQVLSGAPKPRERWKAGVAATNAALGDAVGKLYAEKYFPPEAKARAKVMVSNIITAFGKRIDNLTWMSPQTKARAKEKLSTLYDSIGYPDKWRDYSGLQLAHGDALGNKERSELFDYQTALNKQSKPVDKTA